MNLKEILQQAIADLNANRLRSVLTLFGIIWGIIAIMILLGWGFGFRSMMFTGFRQIGEDLVVAFPGHTSIGVGGYRTGRPVVPKLADLEALRTKCPSIATTNPQISRQYEVKYGAEARSYNMRGVLPLAKESSQYDLFEIFWDGALVLANTKGAALLTNVKPG